MPKGTKRLTSEIYESKKDDDIVHPFWKLKEQCKALVASSNLAPGANLEKKLR